MSSPPTETTLRLTEWTSCGGCAAKWGASVLAELVRELPAGVDPALLVGLAPFDDAAIYRIDEWREEVRRRRPGRLRGHRRGQRVQ